MSGTEKKGGYVYKFGEKNLRNEEKVVMGRNYPWVSISTIKRGASIGFHMHHSDNTHLIITGEVAIHSELHGESGLLQRNDTRNIKPNVSYGVELTRGAQGTFVEGHKVLSPTTRDRYLARDTIIWDDEVADHPYPVDDDVRREGKVTKEELAERERAKAENDAVASNALERSTDASRPSSADLSTDSTTTTSHSQSARVSSTGSSSVESATTPSPGQLATRQSVADAPVSLNKRPPRQTRSARLRSEQEAKKARERQEVEVASTQMAGLHLGKAVKRKRGAGT